MNYEIVVQLVVMVLGAAATYGAIRADIKNIHRQIEDVKDTADQAHHRIDEILMDRRPR